MNTWCTYSSTAGPDPTLASKPAAEAAVMRAPDQRHHLSGQRRRPLSQARIDEPLRHRSPGPRRAIELQAPLHRDKVINHQVPPPAPGACDRSDSEDSGAPARRGTKDVRLPAGTVSRTVQVVPAPAQPAATGISSCWNNRQLPVDGIRPIRAERARPLGIIVLDPVRELPRHGPPRAAPLLFRLLLLRPAPRPAPSSSSSYRPRQVMPARRHQGIPMLPRPLPKAAAARSSLQQASDHRLPAPRSLRLRLDRLHLLPDQRASHGSSDGT